MPKLNFINFKDKILKQLIILILIILTIIPTFILGIPVNAKQTTPVVTSKPFNLYITGNTNYKYCFEVLNLVNKKRINPSSFSFKSSNSKIATVNKYGKVKENNTGNCNVTATVKNTNYNYMFKIYVLNK